MIKKLLEKLNEKAKANNYVIEITCNVRTSQFLREFDEKYQDDLFKYKNQKNNIVVYDSRMKDNEDVMFSKYMMSFCFYDDDYIFPDILVSPKIIIKIMFDDFVEFQKKLNFLVNNLK